MHWRNEPAPGLGGWRTNQKQKEGICSALLVVTWCNYEAVFAHEMMEGAFTGTFVLFPITSVYHAVLTLPFLIVKFGCQRVLGPLS